VHLEAAHLPPRLPTRSAGLETRDGVAEAPDEIRGGALLCLEEIHEWRDEGSARAGLG
jgi:hypothetical protein